MPHEVTLAVSWFFPSSALQLPVGRIRREAWGRNQIIIQLREPQAKYQLTWQNVCALTKSKELSKCHLEPARMNCKGSSERDLSRSHCFQGDQHNDVAVWTLRYILAGGLGFCLWTWRDVPHRKLRKDHEKSEVYQLCLSFFKALRCQRQLQRSLMLKLRLGCTQFVFKVL